ncbi:MAG: hypothetical protein Q3979_05575 [Actinomycetaceae bacterium]|nr:hypothetical protein [Actinomycetaceae bacterium]
MKVYSRRHRDLLVTNPRVRFVDGVAEVSRAQAEQLRPIADRLGLELPDSPQSDDGQDETAQPAKRKARHAK